MNTVFCNRNLQQRHIKDIYAYLAELYEVNRGRKIYKVFLNISYINLNFWVMRQLWCYYKLMSSFSHIMLHSITNDKELTPIIINNWLHLKILIVIVDDRLLLYRNALRISATSKVDFWILRIAFIDDFSGFRDPNRVRV